MDWLPGQGVFPAITSRVLEIEYRLEQTGSLFFDQRRH